MGEDDDGDDDDLDAWAYKTSIEVSPPPPPSSSFPPLQLSFLPTFIGLRGLLVVGVEKVVVVGASPFLPITFLPSFQVLVEKKDRGE